MTSPRDTPSDRVLVDLTLDGVDPVPAVGIDRIEIEQAPGQLPRALLRLAINEGVDPDTLNIPSEVSAPGSEMRLSLGYDGGPLTLMFAGRVTVQTLSIADFEGPFVSVMAQGVPSAITVRPGAVSGDPTVLLGDLATIAGVEMALDGAALRPLHLDRAHDADWAAVLAEIAQRGLVANVFSDVIEVASPAQIARPSQTAETLTLTYGYDLDASQFSTAAPKDRAKFGLPDCHGWALFVGSPLARPGAALTVADMPRRYVGTAAIVQVRHVLTAGQWTTTVTLGDAALPDTEE